MWPEIMWRVWGASQLLVFAIGLRCSDHFQPGSNVARPNVTPPTVAISILPLGKVRVSSGEFKLFFLPSPGGRELEKIFRLERERVLSNDWVVRDENRFYQVEGQSQHHAPAKSQVTVCEWEDGRMEIHYRGQKLRWEEIEARPVAGRQGDEARVREAPQAATKRKWRPGPDHPWRGGYREGNLGSLPLARPAGAPSLASASASP